MGNGRFKGEIGKGIETKDLESMRYFLNMEVARNQ